MTDTSLASNLIASKVAPRRAKRRSILQRWASVDRVVSRYEVPDRYLAETRAAKLEETLKLVKISAITQVVVTLAFIYLFWSTAQRTYTVCLWIAVTAPCLGAIVAARFSRHMGVTARMVDNGLQVATGLSLMIGVAWGSMPIALFGASDHDHQLIVVGTTIGMIADIYVLGPTLAVNFAFAVPLVVGSFVGVIMPGTTIGYNLALLLTIYAVFVVFSVARTNKLAVVRIVDRIRIAEQNATIGLLLRDFEEGSSDWLWEIDESGRFRNVSDRVAEASGLMPAALEGMSFETMFRNGRDRTPVNASVAAVIEAIEARRPFRDALVSIEGPERLYWKLTGKPIFDEAGAFAGFRGVGSDVTPARTAEARIAYLAHYDELTGLANRTSFLEHGRASCEAMRADARPRALLYLDLDGFKTVNDTYGHAFGDILLTEVTKRLRTIVVEPHFLGRLGGDEFAILADDADDHQIDWLARDIIAALGAPFTIDEWVVDIGVSIGIAVAPRDTTRLDALLVKADLALYRAKVEGRGRHRMFVTAYETQLNEQRSLESDLRLALARGEFELHYQPLVSLVTGSIDCFETLIRWTSEKRGRVPPSDFIPSAEAIGLIVPIGQWVLSNACRTAASWPIDVRVAVNISPQHFRRADFIDDVLVALEISGLDPRRLEIEITEGVFLDNSAIAVANLHAIRRRGIRVALDDFGTGFSSLNYLVNFPVDKIKIDRSFVMHFITRHESRAIVTAILTLARDLCIEVTAEGVETMEQALALKALKCDHIQGFLVSAAVEPDRIDRVLRAVAMTLGTSAKSNQASERAVRQ